jgi:hypothetical protein
MKATPTQFVIPSIIILLLCVIAWLTYTKQEAIDLIKGHSVTEGVDWLDSIRKETINRTVQAKLLIQPHFPDQDVLIVKSHPAPGGALIINANIGKQSRSFVVLADNKTFIEGALNSPYLDSHAVTITHTELTKKQAAQNTKDINKFKTEKEAFIANNKYSQETPTPTKSQHLNEKQIQQAFVMPEVSTSTPQATKRDLLEKAKNLESIIFGNENSPNIYVYFDFNCPACLKTHKVLKKLINEGLIRVHYIPVGSINQESIVKTAYALISDENSKRQIVFNHMKQQKTINELLPQKAKEADLRIGLERTRANKQEFIELPNPATPTFLYEHNGISYISIVKSSADIKKIVRLLNNK